MEFEDDKDSRQNRVCYWEVFARDRARFKERIFRNQDILDAILSDKHRVKIYSQRFSPQEKQPIEPNNNNPTHSLPISTLGKEYYSFMQLSLVL